MRFIQTFQGNPSMAKLLSSLFFAALLIVFNNAAVAEQSAGSQPESQLAAVLGAWSDANAPGIAVGILKDGEVVLAEGFGSANLEHQVAISADTVFDIASVSKQFAGMSIAMLALDGKLSLDADIRDYLPEVPDFGSTITVRHLLHHASGVRDWVSLMVMSGQTMEDVISFYQIMSMVRNQTHLNFEPGDEASYSNTGYNLLARIVEVVSGESFPDWTARNLFQPLGMNDTYFPSHHDLVRNNRADSYHKVSDGRYRRVGNQLTALGSSSLHTTVNDLLKWVRNFETGQVGGAEAYELITTSAPLNNGEPGVYGFGLALTTWRELELVSHGGSWAGFRTWLGYFPEERLGVVVLGNYTGFDSGGTGFSIAEALTGRKEAEAESQQPAEEPAESTESAENSGHESEGVFDGSVNPDALDEYTGHFHLADIGFVLSLEREEGGLFYTFLDRKLLTMVANDTFVSDDATKIRFSRDDSGAVSGMSVQMFGGEFAGALLEPQVDAGKMAEIAGSYYSPELDTTYSLTERNGELFATHHRNEDVQLFPKEDDTYVTSAWFMSEIRFDRDEAGQITGLRASSPRSRNIVLHRN
jgi:CubicO group peptidase (beta-lactamase class C family)